MKLEYSNKRKKMNENQANLLVRVITAEFVLLLAFIRFSNIWYANEQNFGTREDGRGVLYLYILVIHFKLCL